MKMCKLGSVSKSMRVQRLHRPSILCNSPLVFFFRVPVLGTFFVFRAYPTMRARLCSLNMSSVFEWYDYVWR